MTWGSKGKKEEVTWNFYKTVMREKLNRDIFETIFENPYITPSNIMRILKEQEEDEGKKAEIKTEHITNQMNEMRKKNTLTKTPQIILQCVCFQ